jgi:catechol 2,3-dioxygenase-like lactoylglutathione lyase family enzyme
MAIEHRSPAERLQSAAIAGSAAAAVAAVDHVVVNTTDADGASALYGGALGIRLALDKTFPEWGARLLFFRIGGITVEIAARLGEGGSGEPDRLWGISYRVPDAEAARARLSAAGFDVSEVRPGRKAGTRVCTVRGEPCGVASLLIGPAAA